jgi:hypothetical protein
MSDSAKIDIVDRALAGGDGPNDIRLTADAFARVSQQYLEVIEDGAQGNNLARVSQVFLEVISTFGTPPIIGPGKGKGKDNAPGQNKPPPSSVQMMFSPMYRDIFLEKCQDRRTQNVILNWMTEHIFPSKKLTVTDHILRESGNAHL